MASNHTSNYSLCQWEATDGVLRVDFNEDNRKIDTALKELADQDAALEEKGAFLEDAISKCGNCQLYFTSYVGTGVGKTELTFPGKPILVNIMGYNIWLVGIQGAEVSISKNAGLGGGFQYAVWNGNSVSFESNDESQENQCNNEGETYYVVCLMESAQ